MNKGRIINIAFFAFVFLFYIGVLVVGDAYLWFAIITVVILGLFFLEYYLLKNHPNLKLMKFFPILFIAYFLIVTATSKPYIIDNPQSVTIYEEYDNDYVAPGAEQVSIKYGIYRGLTLEEVVRYPGQVELNETPTGYELVELIGEEPKIEFYGYLYFFFAVPLYLNSIGFFFNHSSSSSAKIATYQNPYKTVLTGSGTQSSSTSPGPTHEKQRESYGMDDAKKSND